MRASSGAAQWGDRRGAGAQGRGGRNGELAWAGEVEIVTGFRKEVEIVWAGGAFFFFGVM